MKNNLYKMFAICSIGAVPRFDTLVNFATCIIASSIIPLIFALAIAVFIWGVVQYLLGANDETERQKGTQFMLWGIIALTVMVSIWGLVRILTNTFGIDFVIPQVQNTSSSTTSVPLNPGTPVPTGNLGV